MLGCNEGQPLLYECGSLACVDGACRGAGVGVRCADTIAECDEGLECYKESPSDDWGTCVRGSETRACPSGCDTPPAGTCRWDSFDSRYVANVYYSTGTCVDADADRCVYDYEPLNCAEDCRDGVCVDGAACTLDTGCARPLGCKNVAGRELRCVPVDDMHIGDPCDDDVPGYRCDSHLTCVWPSFETTSVCARLCEVDADCGGGGLRGEGTCVRDGTAGLFGYCR